MDLGKDTDLKRDIDFSKYYEEIFAISRDIYLHPELGYKEYRTSGLVKDYISRYLGKVAFEDFARTGFKFALPTTSAKALKMAFIAELDAVYAPSHFHADNETGAAHNCGHYSQVGIALALFRGLIEDRIYEDFDYAISFVFVPAEEFVDLKFREQLKKKRRYTIFRRKA